MEGMGVADVVVKEGNCGERSDDDWKKYGCAPAEWEKGAVDCWSGEVEVRLLLLLLVAVLL